MSIRKIVKTILATHGLNNKFSVGTVNTLDINRDFTKVVTIHDWQPCGLAEQIKTEIVQKTNAVVLFR